MDSTLEEETETVGQKDNGGTPKLKLPPIDYLLNKFYKNKRLHFERQKVFLTSIYDRFWNGLYDSATCIGDENKLIDPSLPEVVSLEVAKIFRTGWEEVHYFPTRLAEPFLEICLFNREEEDFDVIEMSKETLISFVTPEEKETVKKAAEINKELLDVLNKYCPDVDFSQSKHVDDACILAVKTIMCKNTKKTIDIWSPVLVGLLGMEEFRFFMNLPVVKDLENEEYDDLNVEEIKNFLPHKIWKTFFYQWSPSKIEFYFKMLKKNQSLTCFRCGLQNVSPQHILGNQDCEKTRKTMCKDRHDCILRKIEEELLKSMEVCSGSFFRGRDWRYSIQYANKKGQWPKELRFVKLEALPDILVYSLELGEIIIIDLEITSESSAYQKQVEKRKKFSSLVQKLMWNGFQVFESYVLCGSRGALVRDLFYLFKGFGLSYKNSSRALESVCQQLISIPYNDYEYMKKRGGEIITSIKAEVNDVQMDTQ